jgi:WXXGXW repeat (2 copies)
MRKIRLLSLALLILAIPAISFAQISVSITIAPPALVAYSQPICPQSGYLWTPGYWSYGDEGYFWVPGTWVEPPMAGVLWTPGYWGWGSNAYAWNAGYWGPTIGFYGGVNYGYGYGGAGYQGGYWNNGAFSYNTSVNNVDVTIVHNTYQKTVINSSAGSSVSFNGGTGGTTARPTAAEITASHESHTPATAAQTGHQEAAGKNRELLASVNHGKPAIAATSKPGEFTGKGVVGAKGAPAGNMTTENKAATNKPAARTTETSVATNKPSATRATENRTAASKPAATRTNESKPAAENKEPATRPNENKVAPARTAENPSPHVQTASHTQPAARPASAPRPAAHPASEPKPAARPASAPKPEARPATAPRAEQKPPGV